jgi:hypothetical protein
VPQHQNPSVGVSRGRREERTPPGWREVPPREETADLPGARPSSRADVRTVHTATAHGKNIDATASPQGGSTPPSPPLPLQLRQVGKTSSQIRLSQKRVKRGPVAGASPFFAGAPQPSSVSASRRSRRARDPQSAQPADSLPVAATERLKRRPVSRTSIAASLVPFSVLASQS